MIEEERRYEKCPFCGCEPEYAYTISWETGHDEILRHGLHALPGLNLPCLLSGLTFRKTEWEIRTNIKDKDVVK